MALPLVGGNNQDFSSTLLAILTKEIRSQHTASCSHSSHLQWVSPPRYLFPTSLEAFATVRDQVSRIGRNPLGAPLLGSVKPERASPANPGELVAAPTPAVVTHSNLFHWMLSFLTSLGCLPKRDLKEREEQEEGQAWPRGSTGSWAVSH